MKIFSRIWAWILSLLLLIFPSLETGNYAPKLDVNKAVAEVMTAIQERDIDAIEAFMCKNIKDNVPNLSEEIEKLIDAIDGEITSISSTVEDGFYGSSGGKTIEQTDSFSHIDTATKKYHLLVTWEVYNNFSFAERGIRYIRLAIITDNEVEPLEQIARIRATEGIWNMHN